MESFKDLIGLTEALLPARSIQLTKLPSTVQFSIIILLVTSPSPLRVVEKKAQRSRKSAEKEEKSGKSQIITFTGYPRLFNPNIAKTCRKYRAWANYLFWSGNSFEINVYLSNPGSVTWTALVTWLNGRVSALIENHHEVLAHSNIPDKIFVKDVPRLSAIRELRFTTGPGRVSSLECQETIRAQFLILQIFRKQHADPTMSEWLSLDRLELDFDGLDPLFSTTTWDREQAAKNFPRRTESIKHYVEKLQGDNLRHLPLLIWNVKVRGCPLGTLGPQLASAMAPLVSGTWPHVLPRFTFRSSIGEKLYFAKVPEQYWALSKDPSIRLPYALPLGSNDIFPTRIEILKLPKEIQMEILKYLLVSPRTVHDPWRKQSERSNDATFGNVRILEACEDLYHIGIDVLYWNNKFELYLSNDEERKQIKRWLEHHGYKQTKSRLEMMKRIEFEDERTTLLTEHGVEILFLPQAVKFGVFGKLDLDSLEIQVDEYTPSLKGFIHGVVAPWVVSTSSRSTKIILDLSLGERDSDLVALWSMKQPLHDEGSEFVVRNLTFKMKIHQFQFWKAVGMGYASRILADMDEHLRKTFLDVTDGVEKVCRRISVPGTKVKVETWGGKIKRMSNLLRKLKPWCEPQDEYEAYLCRNGNPLPALSYGD